MQIAHIGIPPSPPDQRAQSRGQNDRPYLHLDLLRLLVEVYGVVLTDRLANEAFLLLQVQTALINIGDQGDRLGKVDMDGLVLRYPLIELVRVFDRAVFHAGGAARAFILDDVPGLLQQAYPEPSRLSLDPVYFRIRQDLYVGVPVDLDQFG